MLNLNEEGINEFINSITEAKKKLKYCSKCFNITDTDPCPICSNPKRDKSIICVVEDVKDVVAKNPRIQRGLPCITWLNISNEWSRT